LVNSSRESTRLEACFADDFDHIDGRFSDIERHSCLLPDSARGVNRNSLATDTMLLRPIYSRGWNAWKIVTANEGAREIRESARTLRRDMKVQILATAQVNVKQDSGQPLHCSSLGQRTVTCYPEKWTMNSAFSIETFSRPMPDAPPLVQPIVVGGPRLLDCRPNPSYGSS
jgi:hypothetical protein